MRTVSRRCWFTTWVQLALLGDWAHGLLYDALPATGWNGTSSGGLATRIDMVPSLTLNGNATAMQRALQSDGEEGDVFAFGINGYPYGQGAMARLGLGSPQWYFNSPTQVTGLGSDSALVCAGNDFSMVLKSGGTVVTFGAGGKGQLGLGSTDDQMSPVEVTSLGSDNVLVVAGGQHSMVLKTGGTVLAFGNANYGQLGLGSNINQLSPLLVAALGSDNVLVVAGEEFSLVLKSNGTVFVFGRNSWGNLGLSSNTNDQLSPVQVTALGSNNALMSAGTSHSMVLKTDGTVFTFGSNHYGQLGLDISGNQPFPVQVTTLGSDNALVVAGYEYSMVLKADGTVFAFGIYLGLGLGDYANRNSPVQVATLGSDNALVTLGGCLTGWGPHTMALKNNGTVFSWGYNGYGQLGLGSELNQISPVQVTALGSNNALVVAGCMHSFVLKGPAPFGHCRLLNLGCGCPVGEYDHDSDSTTPCLACNAGNVTNTLDATGATSCSPCSGSHYDDDDDSTTPCKSCTTGAFATPNACNACQRGTADVDADPSTPCNSCPSGTFSFTNQTTCDACITGTADVDYDASTPCVECQPGYYAPQEATTCFLCPAGYIDHDSDPATPCNSIDLHLCPAGSYAAAGSVECVDCVPGYADEDSDPSTPCDHCTPGHQQTAGGQTTCIPCIEGSADTDQDSATACELCLAGFYAAQMSTLCNACPAGEADLDNDPATACSMCAPGSYSNAAVTTCEICQAGRYDEDYDASTPCLYCAAGTYTIGELSACTDCIAGQADEDQNASTPCSVCANGSFAGIASTACNICEVGRSDSDANAATPCAACPRGKYSSRIGRIGDCNDCIAGRYAPAVANQDEDSCEPCSAGQYAGNGSSACISCAPGTADLDAHPATPCSTCPNGTYASCGGTKCSACDPGKVDSDSDATTPCVDCTPGQYWDYSELQFEPHEPNARIPVCVNCEAGKADTDSDSTTPCETCSDGEYTDAGSTSCDNCGLLGLVDHDADPATPCIAVGGACTQFCEQGTEDADCDPSTTCTECAQGQFTEGGYYVEKQTQCRPCASGSYAAQGSAPADCLACPIGRSDNDNNQWTPCQECFPGTFTANDANALVTSNATHCSDCAPGMFDGDQNASTACSLCPVGKANPVARSINASACVRCEPGRWSYLEGVSVCPVCPEGTYRGLDDLDGCLLCDASQGAICEAGSRYPRAAPGYFAEVVSGENGGNTTTLTACVPFPYACLGTCPIALRMSILEREDGKASSLADCPPGLQDQSCTEGYEGPRCSRCAQFSNDFDDTMCDDSAEPPIVNGYYRLESRCIPCPCSWIKFQHMLIGLFLAAVGCMFVLDLVGSEFAEHASTLAAPLLILISFCQTFATFLDAGIPWPSFLRRMMVLFSAMNLNIELTRPECAGDFGALKKLQMTLFVPIFMGAAIFVYVFIAVVKIHNDEGATAEQRHSARSQLKRKIASVATTLFTVGAIFFVKNFLRAFDCVASESNSNHAFMASAPEIECDAELESTYTEIVRLSKTGLAAFSGCFTCIWLLLIKAHRSETPGLGNFAFLADKFEDHFYFWELVIVMRKVLLMSTFMLFNPVVAVLMASLLTSFSLGIHIAARPFEDTGTDWTEMLCLCSQLVTLVAGPVFIILNDPESGMNPTTASVVRDSLEQAGVATLLISLVTALLVQVNVWRAVRSNGDDHEHDDFRIRTEERRLKIAKETLEEQHATIAKLKEAYEILQSQKADVKAMHDHKATENPLQE